MKYLDDVAAGVDSQYDVRPMSSPGIYIKCALSFVHQESCLSTLHRVNHLLMCGLFSIGLGQRWYACNVVSGRPMSRAR